MSAIKSRLLARVCAAVGAVLVQSAQASTLEAINHTHWAINRFSVDGRSGIDIIGPYQGGGGGCCYSAPSLLLQRAVAMAAGAYSAC